MKRECETCRWAQAREKDFKVFCMPCLDPQTMTDNWQPKEDGCPCKGTGLIPAPDGEAICRKHWSPKEAHDEHS